MNNRWDKNIDQITEEFLKIYRELTLEQLNSTVEDDCWSPAQILQHLITINKTYDDQISRLLEGRGKPSGISAWKPLAAYIGKTILRFAQPQSKKKTKTFSVWEPGDHRYDTSIVDAFVRSQEELKEMINRALPLVENGALLSSLPTRGLCSR